MSRLLADAVFPIAYCARGGQHYEDLKRYKNPPIVPLAKARLRAAVESFLDFHLGCLTDAAGGKITHLAVVPSTRRPGPHPLAETLGFRDRIIRATGENPAHIRKFSAETFATDWRAGAETSARVLLFDDTWTTGASLQSFAHTLKQAGATSVVGIVLGRLINVDYAPWRPVLTAIRDAPFDVRRCASAACRAATGAR